MMQNLTASIQHFGVLETPNSAAQWKYDGAKTGTGHHAADSVPPKPVPSADLNMASRIDRALRATGYTSLRNVRIGVATGSVILRGRVSTYYLKQVAQVVALGIPGVKKVQNELDVISSTRDSACMESLENRLPIGPSKETYRQSIGNLGNDNFERQEGRGRVAREEAPLPCSDHRRVRNSMDSGIRPVL